MNGSAYPMSETVRLELPEYVSVDELCRRIRPRWPGSTKLEDDVWLVSARLRGRKNDLALLLREVEAYVAESGLQAIRFHVDGRAYVLEAEARETAAAA
jgi:hypothetical protein